MLRPKRKGRLSSSKVVFIPGVRKKSRGSKKIQYVR